MVQLANNCPYSYCCGSLCNDDISTWPSTKKREVASSIPTQEKRQPHAAKDITQIKRAPVFSKRQDSNCIINLKEDPYTTYGPQIQVGPEDTCELDTTTCGQTYTYTTGTEITNTESHEDSTEIGFSEYIVFSNTFSNGYEHSESQSTSFSVAKNIAPEPGHTAYPTFQPLYICKQDSYS